MISNFQMPPTGFGPGSQPSEENGEELNYLAMPSGMRTFEAHLPEIEERAALKPALDLLAAVAAACQTSAQTDVGERFDLSTLDHANRALVAETLGQGEVSCVIAGAPELRAQEAVFAGVWTVQGVGVDRLEVAPLPADIGVRAFAPVNPAIGLLAERVDGVVNAPSIVTELLDKSLSWRPGDAPHVVNLSLMPHTPEDLDYLNAALGEGSARILSRGYGNCRVTATALKNVWRVQFFNSMDNLILDTFEVTGAPEVASAARDDFEDSAGRLREVLEAI